MSNEVGDTKCIMEKSNSMRCSQKEIGDRVEMDLDQVTKSAPDSPPFCDTKGSNNCRSYQDSEPPLNAVKSECSSLKSATTGKYLLRPLRYKTAMNLFEPFVISLTNTTVEQLCKSVVEPRGEERDHVHITAFSDPSDVPIHVLYLDCSSCDTGGISVSHHDPIPSADDLLSSIGSSEKFAYPEGSILIHQAAGILVTILAIVTRNFQDLIPLDHSCLTFHQQPLCNQFLAHSTESNFKSIHATIRQIYSGSARESFSSQFIILATLMAKTAFAEVCSRYLPAWQSVVKPMAFRINRLSMVETWCETKVPSSGNYHQQVAARNSDQTHATCDSYKTEWDDNLALKGHGVHENDYELSAQDQGVNSLKVGADVVEDVSLRTSNSERWMSLPQLKKRVEKEKERLLSLSEDVSRTHVMRTREGQEADELDMAKSCRRTDAIIDDQKDIPLIEANEGDQSLPGITTENTTIKEASHEAEQLDRPMELFSSLDIVSDKHSGSDKGQ
ncbi:hypothetical protein KIW84_043457 [Lathyrus oleraceus]|uniref:Uncharacterized protein n=1 Tax=Pisum sativum TaxID=3888 RepID=A0A9D4XI17_PEA|nr:hypothetical protein KIW84_043457 [Pisum sativum]